jgi:hypothetical protein
MEEVSELDNNEQFICENASHILSHPTVLERTKSIGGEWRLEKVTSYLPMARFVRFDFMLKSESGSLHGSANIERKRRIISRVTFKD